jgi:hypothetical protein
MPKKLTVQDVIVKLWKKIDRMEMKRWNEGGDLLAVDADEMDYKIEAYEEVIELLGKVGE